MSSKLYVSYASSDMMSKYTGISMLSLFENNKDYDDIIVYYYDMNISSDNENALLGIAHNYGRTIHFIDAAIVEEHFGSSGLALGIWGTIVYAKWLLPSIIDEEINRILYIDSDTMVRGSLKDVYEMDMEGRPIAMSMDLMNIHIRKELQLSYDKRYYNTGMVLFDTYEYRKQKCIDIFMNHVRKVRKNYILSEQDIATVCWNDKIIPMAMEYNYISLYDHYRYDDVCKAYGLNQKIFYGEEEYKKARENPIIVHFPATFDLKPWFSNCIAERVLEYDAYWKKTSWKLKKEKFKTSLAVSAQRLAFKGLPRGIFIIIQRLVSTMLMNQYYKKMKPYMK